MNQVFLYELEQNGYLYRGTSNPADVSVLGNRYAGIDITHDKIDKTSDLSDSGTTLTIGTKDPSDPILAFLAGAPVDPIDVGIFETFGPGYSQIFQLFKAKVSSVKFGKQGEVTVSLTSILGVGDDQVPRVMVQNPCNWKFGEPNTCRFDVSTVTINGEATSMDGTTIIVPQAADEATFRSDPNWFSLGRVSSQKETRLIMKQSGEELTLNVPFVFTAVGDSLTLKPGCDRKWGTCKSKFNNSVNFGGMPFLPLYNQLISQGYMPQAQGKKGARSTK